MRKSYRVKKESEFQRVFETHNSVANHKFVIYQMAKPGQKHFRGEKDWKCGSPKLG